MFYNLNPSADMHARLYRSPEEIERDVKRISDEVARVDSMLSVHNLRIGILGEESLDELKEKIIALESAVSFADKSLRLLARFESAVAALGRELDEMQCVLGV